MMRLLTYMQHRAEVIRAGFERDIDWSENVRPPETAEHFASETIYVICNSGMKWTVAKLIYDRVMDKLEAGEPVGDAFNHPGKRAAINLIWGERQKYFDEWRKAEDKVAYLETIPWIGGITKWHLAKNFGVDCVKPDRHLVRIAADHQTTPNELCEALAEASGDRVATVDYVIWRAAERGWI